MILVISFRYIRKTRKLKVKQIIKEFNMLILEKLKNWSNFWIGNNKIRKY